MYTSRIVINALGFSDYGIYNIVGGIVAMFTFINSTMAAATQRFITIEIGKNDIVRLCKIFSSSVNIHIAIAIIVFLLAETVGVWFVNHKLVIDASRLVTANIVYQFSILSAILIILQVPYNALIIAYERMSIFAYMGIIYTFLKLAIVYALLVFSGDRLVLYAIGTFAIDFTMWAVYRIYCKKQFKDCKYNFFLEKNIYKEMFSFAGWNLCGNIAGTCSRQGIDVVLNLFFGTTINAARAIATQLSGAVAQFVANFQTAMNPQITKSYISNDSKYLHQLIYNGGKFSFLLIFTISLPIIIEMSQVLHIWIGETPDYAVMFCRLTLVDAAIQTLSGPLITAMLATGKIRNYQIIVSLVILLTLPISYLLLYWGASPIWVMFTIITISITSFVVRFTLLYSKLQLSVGIYIRQVIIPIVWVVICSSIIPIYLYHIIENDLVRLISVGCSSVLASVVSVYFIALNKEMRFRLSQYIKQKLSISV